MQAFNPVSSVSEEIGTLSARFALGVGSVEAFKIRSEGSRCCRGLFGTATVARVRAIVFSIVVRAIISHFSPFVQC